MIFGRVLAAILVFLEWSFDLPDEVGGRVNCRLTGIIRIRKVSRGRHGDGRSAPGLAGALPPWPTKNRTAHPGQTEVARTQPDLDQPLLADDRSEGEEVANEGAATARNET